MYTVRHNIVLFYKVINYRRVSVVIVIPTVSAVEANARTNPICIKYEL